MHTWMILLLSLSNWSPVPSKHITSVRLRPGVGTGITGGNTISGYGEVMILSVPSKDTAVVWRSRWWWCERS